MERGSDKHGPRVDEEMARAAEPLERGEPTEARAQELRDAEAERAAPAPADPGAAGDAPLARGMARAELARHLRPSAFPGEREDLLRAARDGEAPPRCWAR